MDVHTLQVFSDSVSCNAICPHCLYRRGANQTGKDQFDFQMFKKARQFALQCGAVGIEIEARGDPLLEEWTRLYQILSEASVDFPQIGLVTPGDSILESQDSFLNLVGWHLTNLTLTVPYHNPQKRRTLLGLNLDYKALVSYLRDECHLVVRAACSMSKRGISSPEEVLDFVRWCRDMGIEQILFREIGIPDEGLDEKAAQWCQKHVIELDTEENWSFEDPARTVFYVNSLVAQNQATPVFVLPWGETVYDMEGVNVVFEKSAVL